jgi:hypothetical protein
MSLDSTTCVLGTCVVYKSGFQKPKKKEILFDTSQLISVYVSVHP